MNFIKETNANGASIPRAALKMSGFRDGEVATLRTLSGAVLLTKRHMTAMELVQVIDSLSHAAAGLLTELAVLCGPCDGCSGRGCPYGDPEEDEEGDSPPNLTDVPKDQLELLTASGACLGELEEKLMSGEVVYHG